MKLAPFFFLCLLECLPWTDATNAQRSAKARDVVRIPVLTWMKREGSDKFFTA